MTEPAVSKDVRSTKTKKALFAAMLSLLQTQSFRKITIKSICEEALISRAAFYAHFIDKYDLLKHCMEILWPEAFNCADTYAQIEPEVNRHIQENRTVLENLVYDADNETLAIVSDHILSTMNLKLEKGGDEELYIKNVVLSNFYAGGLAAYFLWQVKHKFPSGVPPMNRYLYDIIHGFQDWQSK